MRNAIIIFMLSIGISMFTILAPVLTQTASNLETLRWRRQVLAELSRRRRG